MLKRVFCYLKGTSNYRLQLAIQQGQARVRMYANADYAANAVKRQ